MRLFQKEAVSYAVLLIVLFAIAALAVSHTLNYLSDQVPAREFRVAAALIWVLTLGFMLIAGAFGLWAIRFSAEAEGRRRVGRFVDAMDYLRDGLLAVDRKGRVTGSNPAARTFGAIEADHRSPLAHCFPCLEASDIARLLKTREPTEVERTLQRGSDAQTLRFRTQPSEDLTLILVSDVTSMNEERLRSRQSARLQLIGQIARGVAHDFNNLLCAISGHASLLPRLPPGSPDVRKSIDAINRDVEKGIELAGHLLELARPGMIRQSTKVLAVHVNAAANALRDSLTPEWTVEARISELPAVGLTGAQVEQAILNLGLRAADAVQAPGTLSIVASRPGDDILCDVDRSYAGVVLISAGTSSGSEEPGTDLQQTSSETGVLESVISSMLEESGGALHCLTDRDGHPVYRLVLPYGTAASTADEPQEIPQELGAYVAHWSILMAAPSKMQDSLVQGLEKLGAKVNRVQDIVSLLAEIETGTEIDAMIIDRYLFRQEPKGLLKAVLKLRPDAGIVVLCEDPEAEAMDLSSDVVFAPFLTGANRACFSLIESKSLAIKRKTHLERRRQAG